MRSRIAQLFALCCVTSAFPSLIHAQFQAPTKEELEMTSDSKAPGADAVYLYREEKTDDALHYRSEYVRMKVLTEKGKELATVRTPYEHRSFKVTNIEGRTIHSDGTVVPLKTKPTDLMDVKTKDYQINTMVFTLPSVEVGSILEYRLQKRYDDDKVSSPMWEVQQPYYVHKAHYVFMPSPNMDDRLMYGVTGPTETKIVHDNTGRYTYDISDVPPFPNDDWMPPLNSIHWRVEFYYTGYTSGSEFWQKEGKRWAKETDHFTSPSKNLKEAVSKIIAPADTDEQRARKIYEEVMKLDNTDFTRQKSSAERKAEKLKQIKDAEDVWNQKSGSSDDLALLYVALGRAAGLHVYPMQVVNRNRALFDPNFLSLSQLDDYIAVVTLDGKDVLLDPGEKMCPFGTLHWKHSYASGLRLTDKGPVGATSPAVPYTASTISRIAILSVDLSGNVKGTARFILTGQEALHWRQLALKNDEAEVKKQFIESIHADLPDGVQADFDHFLSLDQYNSNLMAFVTVSGGLGTATGKRFFLPEQFFQAHAKHPFVAQDKRTTPIDVHYPRMETDDVTYHLPSELSVEIPPPPGAITWPDHAILKVKATANENDVTIARSAAFNFTILAPKDYSDLHDFFQKVATADQQQLVLTRSQTAKGN